MTKCIFVLMTNLKQLLLISFYSIHVCFKSGSTCTLYLYYKIYIPCDIIIVTQLLSA